MSTRSGDYGSPWSPDRMRIRAVVEQTERFIAEVVEPLRAQYGEAIGKLGESGPRV